MEKEKEILINQECNLPIRFNQDIFRSIAKKDSVEFQNILQRFDMKELFESRDCRGASLLHIAAAHGNKDVVKYLIELGFHVNLPDEHGQTALMIALAKNHFAAATVLLESNADVRICDTLGVCALQIIIAADPATSPNLDPSLYWLPDYWQIVSLIVNKINDDYSFDSKKITDLLLRIRCPLSYVIFMRNWKVMKIMIEKGSPINARDRYLGRTALHLAVQYWKLDKIKLLLNCGADLNVCDYYKKTPCMCIYDNINYSQRMPRREVELVKVLLKHKHKFSVTNNHGLCFVDQMSQIFRKGSKNAIRVVIKESDDDLFLAKNKDQFTLFHAIAENSNPGITELIKGRKIDVNGKSRYGDTALGHAIQYDNYEMIEYLHNEGASTDFEDSNEATSRRSFMIDAHHVRSLRRHFQCMKLLLEQGVDQEVMVRSRNNTAMMLHIGLENKACPLVQSTLAQFAIRKTLEVPIPECISQTIRTYNQAKTHFDSCINQLDEAKTSKIFKSLTVFELLTASDKMISLCARDRSLVSNLSKSIDQFNLFDPYYVDLLRKRFIQISLVAESREKAEAIICQHIGKLYEYNSIVTRIIVDLLDDKDIQKLL